MLSRLLGKTARELCAAAIALRPIGSTSLGQNLNTLPLFLSTPTRLTTNTFASRSLSSSPPATIRRLKPYRATTGFSMRLGAIVPDFRAETTDGLLSWHEYIQGHWSVLFSHPADFTPVCTTELGSVASLRSEFERRGVKVAALSCNDTESHKGWVKDIEHLMERDGKEGTVSYPIISDPKREIAVLYGMLDPEEKDAEGLPMTCRAVFVIKPDKTLALSILYPATTGRNFGEVLRTIDSLQLTAKYSVATPADWSSGKDCMVVPSLSDEEAKAKFDKGFSMIEVPSGKGYLRTTQDPSK